MKEEICERLINQKEYDKWYKLIDKELIIEGIDKLYNKEVIEPYDGIYTKGKKTIHKLILGNSGYYLPYAENSIKMSINERTSYKKIETIKLGWFKEERKEYWESSDFSFDNQLCDINYKSKEITVYDERIYEFCQKFGKKYKFDKLIKCWNGCI